MTSRLEYIPLQTGYSSEELGGHIYIPLDGGPGRKRQDILLPSNIVTCQWLLDPVDYTRFMGFFTTTLRHARDNFLLDLITDIGEPTTHVCRLVGGLPRLTQQKYEGYWVTATLEVDKNPTFTSTVTYTVGEEGAFWIFDGVDDDISMGDVLDMTRTTPRSMFAWYSTTEYGNVIVGKQSAANKIGWRWAVSSFADQDVILCDATASQQIQVGADPRPPVDGTFHHFGWTFNGNSNASGFTFYLDGSSTGKTVTNNNLTSSDITNSEPLQIGNRGTTAPWEGSLKHISIWNRELTSGEVAQVYNDGDPPDLSALSFFSDCIGWWKIDVDDDTGTGGITDYSASGNDGTARNGLAPSGGAVLGQIILPGIGAHFREGDRVRIMNSSGIHPDGNIPLNLDGTYDVLETVVGGAVFIDTPSLVNPDWTTLYNIDPVLFAEYGGPLTGNVNSTVTKVPT